MTFSCLKTLTAATALILLASCAVGPDFMKPAAPHVAGYTEGELPAKTSSAEGPAGAAQSFTAGENVPAEWWKLFGSEPLNRLMEKALKSNPDLKAANATLRQAHEIYLASIGEILPSVDASFAPTREKFNSSAYGLSRFPSSVFTLYNASVSVSYTLDVFGGTRRTIEEAKAQADYQRFERDAAYLTLTANVVTAAIQEASFAAQIKETQGIVDIESKQLDVLKTQFDVGAAPKSVMLQQQATLAQTQASLPTLQKQYAQARHQLAALAGTLPGAGPVETFDLSTLHLPETLPMSLPSKLVEQRPDIRAAEETLHAASADIGVATANMLPQFSITGNFAFESTHWNNIFTPGSQAWSLGGSILQPIFRGGELFHQRKAAIAAYDKAGAQYESTVLQAFRNVADTLRALQYDAEGLTAQVNANNAARDSLELTQAQFKAGAITYPQLLDAQRTYSQARISLVQAQAARLADTAALYQALGGDWNAPLTAAISQPAVKSSSSVIPASTTPAAPAVAASPAMPAAGTSNTPPVTNEKKP